MRPRVLAAVTAALLAAASSAPTAVQAAGQNTLYVNGSSSACTDTGSGTYLAPYCTIQAAADAADPGDVVDVAPGAYAAATLTRSGTASAPIVFTGNGVLSNLTLTNAASAALSLSGASHIRIQNFKIVPGDSADAVVVGGSDVTFRNDLFPSAGPAEPAVHVTGSAAGVTVLASIVDGKVLIDGGSTGTIVTTNEIADPQDGAVAVVGASGTAVTSNTISACGPQISITGSASGTSIENNVMARATAADPCPAAALPENILVDASSAAATTADFNDVYSGAATAYDWAGGSYSTAAAFFAATGQGGHDSNSSAALQVQEGSPLINAADSAAVGEQPVDIYGHPRRFDPRVTPTGAGPYDYYDRGAVQFQDPVTRVTSSVGISVTKFPVNTQVTLTGSLTDTWSDSFHYLFALTDGTTIDAGTTGKATVSFSTPGDRTASLFVVTADGAIAPTQPYGTVSFTVAPQEPLTPVVDTYAYGKYGVNVTDLDTTDAWNITKVTYDFGDGSPIRGAADTATIAHTYAKAGTYTITETATDQAGNTADASARFTTNARVPGTLMIPFDHFSTSPTPAGSTGIAQSSVTAMPNGAAELLAATTAGNVEFAKGSADAGTWGNWQTLSQPGVTAKWVGIAGMPNGSTQLIEVTSAGTLRHTIRNADGTWQSNGWGSPTGSIGFVHASITGMPDGSSQLVAVTTSGVLMHNIRFANGRWQGWRALSQPGVKIVDAALTALPDGSTQIVEVTSSGTLRHDVRYPSGAWQAGGWGTPKLAASGVAQVAICSTAVFGSRHGVGDTLIDFVTTSGGVTSLMRKSDGSWASFAGLTGQTGDFGTAVNNTVTTLTTGDYVTFAVAGG